MYVLIGPSYHHLILWLVIILLSTRGFCIGIYQLQLLLSDEWHVLHMSNILLQLIIKRVLVSIQSFGIILNFTKVYLTDLSSIQTLRCTVYCSHPNCSDCPDQDSFSWIQRNTVCAKKCQRTFKAGLNARTWSKNNHVHWWILMNRP